MGIKTIRVCDVTGKELNTPFHIGFMVDGESVKLEVSQQVAQKLVLVMASKMPDGALEEAADEVFGKGWQRKHLTMTENEE